MNDDYDNAKADKAILEKLTSHTPGPWALRQDGIYDAYGTKLAAIAEGYEDGESLGNARLIAAAPELAEALRDIAAHHDKTAPNDGCTRSARAALQKAGLL